MRENKVIKNDTSVAIKNKSGIIELYPVETVMAIALQKILGIDKINTSKDEESSLEL